MIDPKQILGFSAGLRPTVSVNTVGAGNLGGTKLLDVNGASIADGCIATVYSCGGEFMAVKAATAELLALAALGGLNAVRSTATPAMVWVRLATTMKARFSANPPVSIDAAAGDDDNDGTIAHPLRTAEEFSRRFDECTWLTSPTITISGTVGVLSGTWKSKGGKPKFIGVAPTQSAPITMGTITTEAAATSVEAGFTATAGPALADKNRLKIVTSVTGSHIGAVSYIKGFTGGVLTTPLTKTWMNATSTDPAVPGTEITPTAGDTCVIETLNAAFTGMDINWLDLTTVSYPYFQDVAFQQGAALGQYRFKTNCKPSEANGHCLIQQCTFNISGNIQDFTASDFCFRNCDLQNPTYWSQDGTLYIWDSCMFRGTLTTDNCAFEFINSSCIDSASNVALSFGPGAQGLGLNGFLCISRSIGDGVDMFNGALCIGGNVVWWAPTYSAAANTRNGLTNGLVIKDGSNMTLLGGGFQVNFLRSSTATPIMIADIAQNFPTWDVMHQCGLIWQDGSRGGVAYYRDNNSADVPSTNGLSGEKIYSMTGAIYARGLGGVINSVAPQGLSGTQTLSAGLNVYRKTSPPTVIVGNATTNIVGLDCAAPQFAAAFNNLGFWVHGILICKDTAGGVVNDNTTLRVFGAFRNLAGVVTLRGANAIPAGFPMGDAGLAALVPDLVVVGTTAMLRLLTGIAGITLRVTGHIEVYSQDFTG
jgi:hypothetical protein